MTFDLRTWSEDRRTRVDAVLDALFRDAWPTSFSDVLRYPLFTGGKRMRPLYAVAAAEALGASGDLALVPGAAVELVHTYSLVHDDLPCMDDDDERRGMPTVHVRYDQGLAVLAGDALLTEAFAMLARAPAPAQVRLDWVQTLADASGHRGMVGGQVGDVTLGASITDVADLEQVHVRKTGALIRAAVLMGAQAAGADAESLAALERYGSHIGFAFQLADDVLDADEDEGDDGPPSYVRLLGIDAATALAARSMSEALSAIEGLPAPGALVALARYTVERSV